MHRNHKQGRHCKYGVGSTFFIRYSATQSIEETLASKSSAAARLKVTGHRVTTSDLAPICPARNRIFSVVERTTGGVVDENR